MVNKIGYACMNLSMGNKKTSRTCRKSNFQLKGLSHISELILQNVKDLYDIVQWNESAGIKLYRISSDLFPWSTYYNLKDLPKYKEIRSILQLVGDYGKQHGHRYTTHPGAFTVLGSPTPQVVKNSMKDLETHSQMFDLMGYTPSFENKINIHVGGAYGDKLKTSKRWIKNYNKLSESCRSRVVLENDDKASMYSVKDLYHMFHEIIGIPITFDYFHHKFQSGGLSEKEALTLASTTWPKGVVQCTHYSESRRKEKTLLLEQSVKKHGIRNISDSPFFSDTMKDLKKIKEQAHSDYVLGPINPHGLKIDVVVEAKQKDLAVLKYLNEQSKSRSKISNAISIS